MKDINGVELESGLVCKVHPSEKSQSRKAYYVSTFMSQSGELCTEKMCGYSASINDYLLSRLEVVGTIKTHSHLL